MVLQFGSASGIGRRPEVHDGPDVEWSAAGTEEINGEPAAPQDRADVARRVHVHASYAKVAWLHSRKVVYEYLQDPYR
jgi:hypothetical protein